MVAQRDPCTLCVWTDCEGEKCEGEKQAQITYGSAITKVELVNCTRAKLKNLHQDEKNFSRGVAMGHMQMQTTRKLPFGLN